MILLADLFFAGGGLPRLQLWFDNPNKAAVLLGTLALVFASAAFRPRRRGMSAALAVLAVLSWLGLCLTYSRGGLIGFSVGMLVVLTAFRRRLPKARVALAVALAAALATVSFLNRGGFAAPSADASIGNRLEIWRAVPQMMADAPAGWGVGKAGEAYMGWYQPLRSHERYRTLVSSHLTWLVELGLWGRMGYCAGWLLALGLGLWRWRRKGEPLPFAVWIGFGIAAAFSSVAESPVLWLVPAVAAVPAVRDFVREANCRSGWVLSAAVAWGALLPLALMWCGALRSDGKIARRGDVLTYGTRRPETWIVSDLKVMGGGAYGRALRLYAQQTTNVACGVVSELSFVPADVRRLVLCGKASEVGPERLGAFGSLEEMRVLSPSRPDVWLAATSSVSIRVFCGEFDVRCPSVAHPRLRVVDGNGAFLTHWPAHALSPWAVCAPRRTSVSSRQLSWLDKVLIYGNDK